MSTPEPCVTGVTLSDPTLCATLNRARTDQLAGPTIDPPTPIADELMPSRLRQAMTECTGSSTCTMIAYDFDTDIATKVTGAKYVVDTYSSSAENSGVLVSKGKKTSGTVSGVVTTAANGGSTGTVTYTADDNQVRTFQATWPIVQTSGATVDVYYDPVNRDKAGLTPEVLEFKPPVLVEPPGYELPDFQSAPTTGTNKISSPNVTSVEECASQCDTTSGCDGFNFGGIGEVATCELVKNATTGRVYADNTSGFRKEKISNTQTDDGNNPTGTDFTNEGLYCQDAPACNADIARIITENVGARNPITTLSTTDIESCAYCPVRTYATAGNVTTNEIGVSKANLTPQAAINELQYSADGTFATHLTFVNGGLYHIKQYVPWYRPDVDVLAVLIAAAGTNNSGADRIYEANADAIATFDSNSNLWNFKGNRYVYGRFYGTTGGYGTPYVEDYRFFYDGNAKNIFNPYYGADPWYNPVPVDYVTNGFRLMKRDGTFYRDDTKSPKYSTNYNKTIWVFTPISICSGITVRPGYIWNNLNNDCSIRQCQAGYYCPDAMTETVCTAGNYCPAGSSSQNLCQAGYQCNTPATQEACNSGYYCPAGTVNQIECAYCEFGDLELTPCTRTVNRTCQRCPAGYSCPIEYTCTNCDANEICPSTAGVCGVGQKLLRTFAGTWPCDPGYYCPLGTFAQTLCQVGYYCSTPKTQVVCDSGYYCPTGSTSQTLCTAGYYCATPSTQVPCSGGYYCPAGSTYQRQCTITPALGYVWKNPGVDCVTRTCNAGFYCPNATTETACSSGSQCKGGNWFETDCAAGYYCTTPAIQTQCTAGNYCPVRTVTPIPCTTGNYCPAGSSSQTQCTAGNYCATPATQVACTSGSYCPAGSISATLCPEGYYCSTPATRVQCTANQSCPAGSTSPTDLSCPDGYYCPSGYSSRLQCTAGYYCPKGATVQTPCDSGYYCPTGSMSQNMCDTGYYCSTPAVRMQCRSGFECPAGSIVESKKFTTSGTWTATFTGTIKVLVVGGGGAGAAGMAPGISLVTGQGGGGGGGGVIYNASFPVTNGTTYNITVGTGGTAVGQQGGTSSFSTVKAGGGGAGRITGGIETTADGVSPGGSGGGGAGGTTAFNNSYIGVGSAPGGHDGASGTNNSVSGSRKGGGGGGAGQDGQFTGAGGAGIINKITGQDVYYGGGGGGYTPTGSTGGTGGGGAGGNGSISGGGGGKPGTDGLGGGGGGGNYYATAFGRGGNGVVIIAA